MECEMHDTADLEENERRNATLDIHGRNVSTSQFKAKLPLLLTVGPTFAALLQLHTETNLLLSRAKDPRLYQFTS